MWDQIYNPLGNAALSTIAAAIPVVTLLVLIASGKVKAHIAAIVALIVANIITIAVYSMPANMSIRASLLGVVVVGGGAAAFFWGGAGAAQSPVHPHSIASPCSATATNDAHGSSHAPSGSRLRSAA